MTEIDVRAMQREAASAHKHAEYVLERAQAALDGVEQRKADLEAKQATERETVDEMLAEAQRALAEAQAAHDDAKDHMLFLNAEGMTVMDTQATEVQAEAATAEGGA
jgi:hypothetical protein